MDKRRPVMQKYSGIYRDIQDSIDVVIYQSEAEKPPKRLTDDIEELCTITIDCGDIDWSEVPVGNNQAGVQFYKVEFDIRMNCSGCTVKFDILYQGRNVGCSTKVMPCTSQGNIMGRMLS